MRESTVEGVAEFCRDAMEGVARGDMSDFVWQNEGEKYKIQMTSDAGLDLGGLTL